MQDFLFIFDGDGVIFDSWPQHHAFLCDMAEKYNEEVIIPPIEDSYHLVSNGMANVVRKAGFTEEQVRVIIENDYSLFGINYPVPLFSGAKEMIIGLSKLGGLAIVSSNEKGNVLKGLGDLKELFRPIVTRGMFSGKREGILHCLKENKIPVEKAVFIGDTFDDFEQSLRAGVSFVASGYGWQIRFGDKGIEGPVAEDIKSLFHILTSMVRDFGRQPEDIIFL